MTISNPNAEEAFPSTCNASAGQWTRRTRNEKLIPVNSYSTPSIELCVCSRQVNHESRDPRIAESERTSESESESDQAKAGNSVERRYD